MKKALLASVALITLMALSVPSYAATKTLLTPAQELARTLGHGINLDNLLQGNSGLNMYGGDTDNLKLRAMGINNVVVPIEVGYLIEGLPIPAPAEISEPAIVRLSYMRLDAYIPLLIKGGFKVTLSVSMEGQDNLTPEKAKAVILQANQILAKRYAGKYSSRKLLFNVARDPNFTVDDWNSFAPEVVAAIRQDAPNNTIIIEPAGGKTENLPALKPLSDTNIIYAMNVFTPTNFTLQEKVKSRTKLPVTFANTQANKDALNAYMSVGVDWARANNVPLVLEEFGVTKFADPQSRGAWITDVRQYAEANHVPWVYASFADPNMGLKPTLVGREPYDPLLEEVLSIGWTLVSH